MADNVAVSAGLGTTVAADEVVDGTLGTVKVQYVKLMDGTLDGTAKAAVGANGLKVDGSGATQPVSGTVAATQSGAWQITNSANSAQAQVVANSDALANQVGLSINGQLQVYNGTTWDRLRGDTTAGAFVQIKNAAGSPGNVKLTDGTNAVAVKAASTAPVATDPALVVAISPNSVNANGQAVMASSAPVAIASNQSTLAVAYDTTQIANGVSGTMLTPTKVKISVASATTTTLVALQAAKKIRILSMYLVSTAANTVTFQSHTTTANNDGGAAFAANGGYVLPFNPLGWFDSTAGEALDMVTSGAGQVSGQLVYVAV